MEQLREMIKTGKMDETVQHVKGLLDSGINPEDILKNGMISAMDIVGDLFQNGEYFLPEMLIAARAMQKGMDILKPCLEEGGIEPLGKAVIGTVEGDLHDIGKNLVSMSLKGAGFDVIDLGVDVSPEKYIEAIKNHNPVIIGMSAMITTTMPNMKGVIDAVTDAGLRDRVKIMIGGAPTTGNFAEDVGADFYGEDSTSARDYAKEIVKAS